jgi:hypothetical protein
LELAVHRIAEARGWPNTWAIWDALDSDEQVDLLAYDWHKRHVLDEVGKGLADHEMLNPDAATAISIARLKG